MIYRYSRCKQRNIIIDVFLFKILIKLIFLVDLMIGKRITYLTFVSLVWDWIFVSFVVARVNVIKWDQ